MKSDFHKKIFIVSSLFIVSSMILFFIIYTRILYNEYLNSSKDTLTEVSDKTANELSLLLNDMDKISLYVSTNPDIMKAFHEARISNISNAELINQISIILTSITVPNDSSRFRISLFNSKGNFISTGIPYDKKVVETRLFSHTYHTWYEEVPIQNKSSNIILFEADPWTIDDNNYISLYRQIFDSSIISVTTGIIHIQCPEKVLYQILNLNSAGIDTYLYDNSNKCIYSSTGELYHLSSNEENYKFGSDDSTIYFTDEGYQYSGTLLDNGLKLLIRQSRKLTTEMIFQFIIIVFLMSAIILTFVLTLLFKIIKTTTEPLRQLTDSVKKISVHSPYLSINSTEYSNEFVGLTKAFEEMLSRLTISMKENIKRKEYEMRANMLTLQSQMSPHFLCNMLTIIKEMSKEDNEIQIGEICDYLASMLRYISNYEEMYVTLQDELRNANNYLNLMKIRYENMFSYEIFIDEDIDISTIKVPKIILQPILENCFQHGFQKVIPPWLININLNLSNNGDWELLIIDNGIGITDEEILLLHNKINDFINNPSDTITSFKIGGMGIVNTIARLQLYYKKSFTFKIEPSYKRGTIFRIGGNINDKYFSS